MYEVTSRGWTGRLLRLSGHLHAIAELDLPGHSESIGLSFAASGHRADSLVARWPIRATLHSVPAMESRERMVYLKRPRA
jgi:hypothetical protein